MQPILMGPKVGAAWQLFGGPCEMGFESLSIYVQINLKKQPPPQSLMTLTSPFLTVSEGTSGCNGCNLHVDLSCFKVLALSPLLQQHRKPTAPLSILSLLWGQRTNFQGCCTISSDTILCPSSAEAKSFITYSIGQRHVLLLSDEEHLHSSIPGTRRPSHSPYLRWFSFAGPEKSYCEKCRR